MSSRAPRFLQAGLPPPSLAGRLARGRNVKRILAIALGAAMAAGHAEASMLWRWTCTGPGFEAKGQFTTGDKPDADGSIRSRP